MQQDFIKLLRVIVAVAAVWPAALEAREGAKPQESAVALDAMRAALDRYFETQRVMSRERGDWKLSKEILQDRVSLMKSQVAELKAKTAEEEQTISEADTEREKLQEQMDRLMEVQAIQQEQIARLESRTQQLLAALPDGVKSKLETLVAKLPKEDARPEEIRASISERYQNVLGILNEVNKFNADILVTNERHLVSRGRKAEVRTIYVGLGQAFYAGSGETADSGGRGVPVPGEGWKWSDDPKIANAAGRVIKMHAGEEVAAFVPLPVTITSEEGR